MEVITVFSLKGGTGKTTLASTLCVAALSEGASVAALDLDTSSGGLRAFVALRADKGLPAPYLVPTTDIATVKNEIAWLRAAIRDCRDRGVDRLVIDTSASARRWMVAACTSAQMLITPVQPSPIEIESIIGAGAGASRTHGFIQRIGERRGSPPAWIVAPNRQSHLPTRLGRRVADQLAAQAPSRGFDMVHGLRDRVAYREMFETGLTPLDLHGDNHGLSMSQLAARSEIRLLTSQLGAAHA